jgi:multicomponent Na+:H+ antiporter subunit E
MRWSIAVVLLGLWLLAWGEVTLGNVASGLLLIVVLGLVFPGDARRPERVRVHPVALVRLAAYVAGQMAVSTLLVAREILSRESRVRIGVVGHRLQEPSDLTLTLMANILALSPGTMPVDVSSDPPVLHVHFLLLSDVEAARRTIARLEARVVAAVRTVPTSAGTRAPDDRRGGAR